MTMTRNMTRHPICPHKYCIVLRFESDMLHKFMGVSKDADSRFLLYLCGFAGFL